MDCPTKRWMRSVNVTCPISRANERVWIAREYRAPILVLVWHLNGCILKLKTIRYERLKDTFLRFQTSFRPRSDILLRSIECFIVYRLCGPRNIIIYTDATKCRYSRNESRVLINDLKLIWSLISSSVRRASMLDASKRVRVTSSRWHRGRHQRDGWRANRALWL